MLFIIILFAVRFRILFVMLFFQNPLGVSIGGTIGHALCTGLAVMGGRLVAQKISVRTGKWCV